MTGSSEDLLTKADVPDAVALSDEAGWNQIAADWELMLRLWPQSAFCVREEGKVVATTIAVLYDKRLAWIGMVLTKSGHRGKGHATTLLQKALDYVDRKRIECVKLDATEDGAPVYQKLGFVPERGVSRWVRRGNPDFILRRAKTQTWLEVDELALDRLVFGADRSALLQALSERETHGVAGQGFGIMRPGRVAAHFGPCVAQTRQSLRVIMEGVLNRHGGEDVIWDICDDNEDAGNAAMALGFTRQRRLTRMRRGGTEEHLNIAFHPKLAALAGFEFG